MILFVFISSIFWIGRCDEVIYYIAAVDNTWDYAPSGQNLITEDEGISEQYLSQLNGKIGHVYKKAMYREFTDETFSTEMDKPSYLGITGPIITANVGDRLKVHFMNKAGRPYAIRPLALSYNCTSNENGDGVRGNTGINSGHSQIYVWDVEEINGPRQEDPDCVTSLYYSDVDMVKDVNSGLVGIILICRNGTDQNVRRKYFALYVGIVDENQSWYLDTNIQNYIQDGLTTLKNDSEFIESNKMHSINGYVYGNLPRLTVCLNDEISLHIAALGGETDDVHSFRVFGHSLVQKTHRTDAIPIYPGVTATAMFNATELGNWLIGSQNELHWKGGMLGLISVNKCDNQPQPIKVSGKIRRYFIAAEQVTDVHGVSSEIIFQQYTDGTFTTRVQRPAADTYLGTLGPLISAEVGDFLKVVFLNKGSRPYSIYPRGLRMSKYSEGVSYIDGTSVPKLIPPGGKKTYYWTVPQSFAPTTDDPICRTSFYTSGNNLLQDSESGLIGPILICKEGTLNSTGYPLPTNIEILQQIQSHQKYMIDKPKDLFLFFKETTDYTLQNVGYFNHSSPYIAVNGLGAFPSIPVCYNETIDLHLLFMGKIKSFITVYFNGNLVMRQGSTKKAVGITSSVPLTVKMSLNRKGYISVNNGNERIHYNMEGCESSVPYVDFKDPSSTFYIAVVEDDWDYSNGERTKEEWRSTFTGSIGPVYKKAFYRQFYTEYFYYLKGKKTFIGPTLKVATGDSIKILFKNKASRNFTIHADGILVEVEGKQNNETVVEPGQKSTFIWRFPADIGPRRDDPPCILHPYYSNINTQRDITSGLMGPLIICKEAANEVNNIPLFIGDIDETQSWYFEEILRSEPTQNSDEALQKGNVIYVINGYADGTFPDMDQITPGSEVYLHFVNMGNRFHSIHLDGNYFNITTSMYSGTNVLGLYPGTSYTVKVKMEKEGLWKLQGLGNEDKTGHLYGPYYVGLTKAGPSK